MGIEKPVRILRRDEVYVGAMPDTITSLEERSALLAAHVPEREREALERLSNHLRPLEETIKSFPQVQLLRRRAQLGGKTNPAELPDAVDVPSVTVAAFHTRYDHAAFQAELAKAAAVRAGLSDSDARAIYAGAWLHDVGHCAFSHIGDRLLVESGMGDHEERSIAIVHSALRRDLESRGVDIDGLTDVIRERGSLGTLESMLDTLSYLVLDTESVGRRDFPDGGASYLRDLVSLGDGHTLIVRSTEKLKALLEIRAEMMHDVYYHPRSKIAEEANRQFFRIMIRKGFLRADELMTAGDSVLEARAASLTQYDPAGAIMGGRRGDTTPYMREYHDLRRLAGGVIVQSYERTVHLSEAEAQQYLFARSPRAIEGSFIVKPYDYTKKTLTVLVNDGTRPVRREHVRATETPLREEDSQYIAMCPKPA